jgi:flagellin-like hook-associated protein FlgL
MSIEIEGATYTGTGATAGAAATALETALAAVPDMADARVTTRGAVTITYNPVANEEFTALVDRYNEIRNQLDTIALDSGYKGKNLLNSAVMTVKFEGSHTLEVQGFDASTTGLGIGAAAWATEAAIDASIVELDNAAVTLRSEASKLSGNLSIITVRQDFSDNMINTLTEGADKLTLADANEEGANMLMLQTRQSLSTTALSLSAQAAQSVLRLFQ